MIWKKLTTKKILAGAALGAMLSGAIITGCTFGSEFGEDRDSDRVTVSKDVSERERGESGGEKTEGGDKEHGSNSESRSESGSEKTEGGDKEHGSSSESRSESGSKKTEGSDKEHGSSSESGSESGGEKTESGSREHGSTGESGSESGGEKTEGGDKEHGSAGESGSESAGSEEASANMLTPDETFDAVRGGARLILSYDAASNLFEGTVENTTNGVLDRVRIEVHLSNGTELGPTPPIALAPGEVLAIILQSTPDSFDGWVAHAEVGSSESGGEHGSGESGSESSGEARGEHGGGESGSESGSESGGESHGAEANEAAMSSPIIPLDQSWNGVLGGLAVSMQYDAATQSVRGTAQNTLTQTLCYVQAEPHLKSGTTTVGELGPEKLGDLNPWDQVTSSLSVADEPNLAGVSYDGYVIHMEVFDCGGAGPVPHTGGEGSESGGGESSGESGSESGGEEGSANMLTPDETFDAVRGGARLILSYDAASNLFEGTVENTTNGVLNSVRIEVHLSNGTELGPTPPIALAPGEVLGIILQATPDSFDGWIAHAEVGGGESGGEHGSESGGERRGEHGGRGERGGGG